MQPLAGIRILDLTRLLPGPWCTMLLGDLGADVLKIENKRSGGDITRQALPSYGPGEDSIYFANVSRNKSSLLLDLKDGTDRDTFLELVETADVVIENYRPGVADRLGVGYAACKARNGSIIYCAVSGYGQDGPRRDLGGHDLNVAGMSGFLQPDAAQTPVMPSMLMGDYAGATAAAISILGALAGRARNGAGAFIDVSMLDALLSWTNIHMIGVFAKRAGTLDGAIEGWGGNPRYTIYPCRDGRYLTVSLLEKKYWDAFCRFTQREDLINPDETEADRLTTHGARGEAYRALISETLLTDDRDNWAKRFQELALPICPVRTMDEVFDEGSLGNDAWFQTATLPSGRTVPQLGFPFRMQMSDGTNAFAIRNGPPARDQREDMADANA